MNPPAHNTPAPNANAPAALRIDGSAQDANLPGCPPPATTASSIQVEVLLFAAAAEAAAQRQCRLELPAGSPVATLAESLAVAVPTLAKLINVSRWAVDCEFVSDDYVLQSDMTIAMIPPVSGG